MKKLQRLIGVFMIVILVGINTQNLLASEASGTARIALDVTNDRIVDIYDILAIQRHILGITMLSGEDLVIADVTKDNMVDIYDILEIQRYILGIHSHSYIATVTKEPTCTEKGIRTYTCKTCGNSYTEEMPALGHVLGAWEVTKAATHTESGLKVQKCTVCGEVINSEVIPKLICTEHTYASTITIMPTCTEKGIKTYTCTKCGNSYTEEISTLGHTLGAWEITKEPTCTETGLKVQKCTVCGEVVNSEVIPKLICTEHNYVGVVTKEPTCTESGIKTFTCTKCGNSYTEEIPTLYHVLGNWEITKQPTCTESDFKERKCPVCGEVESNDVIPALGHTLGDWEVSKEPTYTETGLKVQKCTVCGEVVNSDVIPKLVCTEHTYESAVTKMPTCTEKGIKTYTCTKCGNSYTEEIPTLGHVLGDWEIARDTTCTREGLKVQKCSVCGQVINSEVIPILEHGMLNNWEVAKAATYIEDGLLVRRCTTGGEVLESKVIPSRETPKPVCSNHQYHSEMATDGKTIINECINCGYVYTENTDDVFQTYTVDMGNGETTTVRGRLLQAEADKGFELLNEYRISQGKSALTTAQYIKNWANQRAIETAVLYDHVRPNGTFFDTIGTYLVAENLCGCEGYPEDAMDGWKTSSGHNANMLISNAQIGATAAFQHINNEYGDIETDWIQQFRYLPFQ